MFPSASRQQHGSTVTTIKIENCSIMSISQSIVPPAKYITGVVLKKNDKKKLGISFVSKPDDKDVYIRKVEGKFRKYTNLVPCLKVLYVNGQMVFTAMEAADIIRQTPNGQHVQVIAGGSCTELKKESRFSSSSSLGISLEQVPEQKDLVRISSVDRGNYLLSGLEVGNILLSINGRSITSVSKASLLLRVNKSLTLISVRPQSYHGGLPGLPLKPTLEQQLQLLDNHDYEDDSSERPVAALGELHLLPPQHDDQEQRIVLQQDPPTFEEDERLTEKQHLTTETHSLPLPTFEEDERLTEKQHLTTETHSLPLPTFEEEERLTEKQHLTTETHSLPLPTFEEERLTEKQHLTTETHSLPLPTFEEDERLTEKQHLTTETHSLPLPTFEEERLTEKQHLTTETHSLPLPTFEEDERLVEKQYPTTETHSLPLNEENLRLQHQDEQEHLPEHPRAETRISIASSDASGLPDVILNLQTQNDLRDEALASLLGGLADVRPLLFTEERGERQELEDDEDLQSFLTEDTKEEEGEEEDTVEGEFEYFPTKNIFNESMNFFRAMETVVIEAKKEKKEQERQPEEEEQQQQGREGGGGEEEKEEYPALFVADEDEDNEEELVVEEQARAIETDHVCVPEQPPAQVHIHHFEEEEQSFLTEEEKDEFIIETLPLPRSKLARTPRSTPKANNRKKNRTKTAKKSQSPIVLQDEEDDDTIVGETEYTPSRSIFTRGFKLFQEFVFDAASCEKPSSRYNTYDDHYVL
jgi:hypothetical protein